MLGRTEILFIIIILAFMFHPVFTRRGARKARRKWFFSRYKNPFKSLKKAEKKPDAVTVDYEEVE